MPLFSVCIPAYNRASLLPPLLDSILSQDSRDYEIIISENDSPERQGIRAVAEKYAAIKPGHIRYSENQKNLGYDGNLRRLIGLATGEYCLFMGNDDLMCPGALGIAASVLRRHPGVGIVVRSYADFIDTPDKIDQEYRYFPTERILKAGSNAVTTTFRRAVVLSGMIVHRASSLSLATDRFDGSLLYQLWLVGNIASHSDVVFVPHILVLRRKGVAPDFGHADVEQGRFVPREQTPESSLHFMRGMLRIAAAIEQQQQIEIYRKVVADLGTYSYPFLSIQANRPLGVFVRYWWRLAFMGFGRIPLFHAYALALAVLGAPRMDRLIDFIKRRIGHTPRLGDLFHGEPA